MTKNLVEVKNLCIDFATDEETVHAVKGIDFAIPKGKTLGLVGESGSGKSVTALSIMRLLPHPIGKISQGEIFFQGQNLASLKEEEMRKVRGNKIGMIFQEPMTSLNPVFTIGNQLVEGLMLHKGLTKERAYKEAVQLLDRVKIVNPKDRIHSYPHELSGGQRQRVMIAMAISCSPELLIADEPTTALDVTIQKEILDLIKNLQKQYHMSVLFITHDLGVVSDMADEVAVMYQGKIYEKNSTKEIFSNPQHPYTKGLIACRPSMKKTPLRLPTISDFMDEAGNERQVDMKIFNEDRPQKQLSNDSFLEVRNLSKHYSLKKTLLGRTTHWVKAVNDVSFSVRKGETLGLVGGSGCGKTTLGRTLLRLIEPTAGDVLYNGENIMGLDARGLREMRRKMQIIFQDPFASLNPRMTVRDTICEPLKIHNIGSTRKEWEERAEYLMENVGLEPHMLNRYPHEFSGGQRQRISIARALAVDPEFIICDESVSALDVSVQAQVLNLFMHLQEKFNLTYIFISHDMAVVKFISDRILVMDKGKVIEEGTPDQIYSRPKEDYTRKLISAIPSNILGQEI